MFLVFDGPDGSGKTTLATSVANALAAEGHSVCATREPFLPLTRAWLFDERVTARELAVEAPTEVCMGRQAAAGKTLDRFEARASLQENVRLKYLQFAQTFGYPVIDGSGSPADVLALAMPIVRAKLAARVA